MCGIYGTTEALSDLEVHAKLIGFKHRGPDAQRQFRNDKIILGHNRLSILDLDERAHQPFRRESDVVVFNGEIYNFKEIKSQLEAAGFFFETSSDTEVLLRAYQRWGNNVVDRLNGMFSFVIYDHYNQRLFGARDRFGKKPFYYKLTDNHFSFASNLYALIDGKYEIDEISRQEYFWYGHVPGNKSIVSNVAKLEPAHAFDYDLTTRKFNCWRYWKLQPTMPSLSRNDYMDKLEEILADAVKIRMVADVPIGVFLSGGIDSTIVTLYASNLSTNIKTFSISFVEAAFNESSYAELVAKKLGTLHTTIPCSTSDLYRLVEDLPHFYDEPFADASAIPSMLLAQKTKEHVTVALSGDGGDEIFYGYSRYRWFYWIEKFFSLPAYLRAGLLASIKVVNPNRMNQWEFLLTSKNREEAYLKFMGSVHGLMTMPESLNAPGVFQEILENGAFTTKMANWDVSHYLPDDILTKVDRATMAFSLEGRSPLLDYRLAELTRSNPLSYNFSPFEGKIALKALLMKSFDRSFLNRPKQGFTLPLKDWFRNEMKEEVNYWVHESGLLEELGLFNVTEYRKRVEAHMKGQTNFYPEIWKLMVYGRWSNHMNTRVK